MKKTITSIALALFGMTTLHAEAVKVATRSVEPFSFEQDGKYVGYSVELWEEIARKLNLQSSYVPKDTVADLIEAVEKGEAEIGVAAISITKGREERVDFTHPFYQSGLQIMVQGGGNKSLWSIIRAFITPELLQALGFLFLLTLVTSHLLWVFERKRNAESFPESYIQGIGESFWWSINTLISGGCENKAPIGLPGRLLAMVWTLAGITLWASFTAVIASTLTLDRLEGDIRGSKDLPGKVVATVRGSTAANWLRSAGGNPLEFNTVDEAIAKLRVGECNAVVFDQPILRYKLGLQQDSKLRLVEEVFDAQSYGIALKNDSPLREPINRVLLELRESGFFDRLNTKWFGDKG